MQVLAGAAIALVLVARLVPADGEVERGQELAQDLLEKSDQRRRLRQRSTHVAESRDHERSSCSRRGSALASGESAEVRATERGDRAGDHRCHRAVSCAARRRERRERRNRSALGRRELASWCSHTLRMHAATRCTGPASRSSAARSFTAPTRAASSSASSSTSNRVQRAAQASNAAAKLRDGPSCALRRLTALTSPRQGHDGHRGAAGPLATAAGAQAHLRRDARGAGAAAGRHSLPPGGRGHHAPSARADRAVERPARRRGERARGRGGRAGARARPD